MTLTERIKLKAIELGFDLVGIAPATQSRHGAKLLKWLESGYHGEMAWLARDPGRRMDPRKVVPGALSVVAVGLSYYTEDPPAKDWNDPLRGRIARYAWGPDYHDVLTPRLRELSDFIAEEAGHELSRRAYVDTGPVLEREIASNAGLGFIGKNSLLITPQFGSYVFLGEVIVDVELDYDRPAENEGALLHHRNRKGKEMEGSCGTCRRCIDICPTHAFPAPYIVDSNKCISYLTIEQKGSIPEELRPLMGNWIFGCDECQSVCPWVKRYAAPSSTSFLSYERDRSTPWLPDLMTMNDEAFRERFRGTPMKRAKRRGLLRNVAVALGNSASPDALPPLETALEDPEDIVRSHAEWAIARISSS